jgi:indolepyruvate ferredoxin oxidoreductase beta subunit
MSQRGGSVECTVVFGDTKSSFLTGQPDIVLAFEPLELLRHVHRIGDGTRVFLNDTQIVPGGVLRSSGAYPPLEDIVGQAEGTGARVDVVDGAALARGVGEKRTLNVAILGVLAGSGCLPISAAALWSAIESRCAPRFVDANRRAFESGASLLEGATQPNSTSPSSPAGEVASQ